MTAVLLPHEEICGTCEGEGVVPDFHPCGSTGTEPALATGYVVTCHVCKGEKVIVTERRERPRDPSDEAVTRLINMLTFDRDDWKAKCGDATDQADRLIRENEALRKIVHDQARRLHRQERKSA